MKRNATAALIGALTLVAGVGIIGFTNNAQATRSYGVETGNMASVDIFALVDRALSTEEMTQEREKYETDSNASLESVQQQLAALQQQLGNMTAEDPNAQAAYQQYQQLQNQAQYLSQQASNGYQTLIANQIASAYKSIYAATNEIASENGYEFVFATRSDGELLQTDTITGITQEILARPLVTPPSATDLTEMVRVKLGYPEEVEVTQDEVPATEGMVDGNTDQPATETDSSDEE